MSKGIGLLSLLLLTITAQAAVDNQIIESEAASTITLAGRIGEAAMFAVQADDDDDLEIFATASSNIDNENDHWLLLDWDSTNYQVINSGELQSNQNSYLSAYQVSHSELLLGHAAGLLTTLSFTDDNNASKHTINESSVQLSSLTHEDISGVDFDGDIHAIVSLEGTDQTSYTVICTEELIHILTENELTSSLQDGGYCQAGNIDYDELDDNSGVYDQELVLSSGLYYNFNGNDWLAKTNLSSVDFGDNFLIANIDDDAAEEILSQQHTDQVQSFSPAGIGSWVFISGLQNATGNFYVTDSDADENMEILFDYIYTEEEPHTASLNRVSWDTNNDSHITDTTIESPYLNALNIKRLATTLTENIEGDYFLFTSNAEVISPTSKLLTRLDGSDLSTDWSGIYSSHARSFDTLTKTTDGDSLDNHHLVQIEQVSLGEDLYEYAYKFISAIDLSFSSIIEPEFNDDEIVSVNSLISFDLDEDGVDELHAGGTAVYDDNSGIVISSNIDGSVYSTLSTPTLASVSALYIGDVNLESSADIVATGEDISEDGSGIGIHFYYDNTASNTTWFSPGSGDTDFKTLVAANIKGTDEREILGLHSQLASYNPNAEFGESSFYNLSNIDLNNFSPITLENRDYQYALATDASGMLHLIEPKDFDILASVVACTSELTAIASARINNNIDIAFAVCEQQLLSWVVEYDEDVLEYGYSFYELDSTDLGNADVSSAQLISLITDPEDADNISTHLFTLFANKFQRFELNVGLGDDTDTDGYLNYRDVFPQEITQWEDNDRDSYGDNPDGADADPSLNDIDNDGITDDNDLDNDPTNDFDTENDIDHGDPKFNDETLITVTAESTALLTTVTLTGPGASDIYDDFKGNGSPTITAKVQRTALLEINDNYFEANLAAGTHTVEWLAQDVEGNSANIDQEIWVYPSIAFKSAYQRVGETQTAQVILSLSGTSPEYPLEVSVSISGGDVADEDVTESIAENLTVTFADGETQATISLEFLDDSVSEEDETLQLTILDTFNSEEGSESWTVNSDNNLHTITVEDVNLAPQLSYTQVQAGIETTIPTNIAGIITLSALATDENEGDSHTYNWDLNSLGLATSASQVLELDPETITPADYEITLTVTDDGLPNLSAQETFTLTLAYGDTDGDSVLDNEDAFPNEPTQWDDTDQDNYGDNPDGINPDPSLNDFDNDGVTDDSDNENDTDNGSPVFNEESLETITSEFITDFTTITLSSPEVNDLYDDFNGNDTPTISASIGGTLLRLNDSAQFEINLAPGAYIVDWQAQDTQGNTANLNQNIWVYPSIAFENSIQRVEEAQTAQVLLTLSGTSPEYPLEVSVSISNTNISSVDVTEDITENFIVSFADGETQASISLEFLEDEISEEDETLELTILDTFNSEEGNESWTIDNDNNIHSITVADVNLAPQLSYSQKQGEIETSTPTNIAGIISLNALVNDVNFADQHTYNWDLESLSLGTASSQVIELNPATITPASYDIILTVTDNGVPNLATEIAFTLILAYGDTDGDGTLDNLDAFPEDASESLDTDSDLVGNNSDAFPEDASETIDSDEDGVGDNADVFPDDNSETVDSDGDGVGDNADAFDNDPTETTDTDNDGVGDNADAYPRDATKASFEDNRDVEGTGSVYFYLFLLLPLLYRRRK